MAQKSTVIGNRVWRGNAGMTLVEIMMATFILTMVMGILFSLAIGLGDTAAMQDARITTGDEARAAMMGIARDLRQAANSSITGIPGKSISYRVATDADGNGSAVDVGSNIELSSIRTIQRDLADANGDGVRGGQIVRIVDGTATVLANDVIDDEDTNANGILEGGEDANGNGQLDRGLWFERDGSSIRITIDTQNVSRRGHHILTRLTETVFPRN